MMMERAQLGLVSLIFCISWCVRSSKEAFRYELSSRVQGVDSALVVCSRWYGGVHLGNDRFKHINAVGRAALEAADLIPSPSKSSKSKHGKH